MMEKSLNKINIIYEAQEKLINQISINVNKIYNPETNIKLYQKYISDVKDINETMKKIEEYILNFINKKN